MADENRYCNCTTPKITIKLNKQGPQGLKGQQGDPGFSPVINVAENTSEAYKLNITTIDGSYQTPNLKANLPSGGVEGTVLTKNSSVSGDASFKALPTASLTDSGVVQLATVDNVLSGYQGNVVDGYRFQQGLLYSAINGGNAQTNNYNENPSDTDSDSDTDNDTDTDSDTDTDIDNDSDMDTDTDNDLGGV